MKPKDPSKKRTPRPNNRRSLTNVGGKVKARGPAELREALTVAAKPRPDDDGRSLTHGFHSWPGRTHPHTVRHLMALCPAGKTIHDPFLGGGTVAAEAMLAGRACLASDINPIGMEVAWARTRRWTPEKLDQLQGTAQEAVRRARTLREGKRIPDAVFRTEGGWYDPPALAEVWSLAKALGRGGHGGPKDLEIARMLRTCLSSILVKASKQASDSVAVQDRDHTWIPRGRVEQWFLARVSEHAESLRTFAKRVPRGAPEPSMALADARRAFPDATGLGGIVTSPPYPGVFDYVDHHRRRYVALGLDAKRAYDQELGSRREVAELGAEEGAAVYTADMANLLARWARMLAPDGKVLLVVGDGQHSRGLIPALPLIEEATEGSGLAITGVATQKRPVFGGAKKPASKTRTEHLICLERAT